MAAEALRDHEIDQSLASGSRRRAGGPQKKKPDLLQNESCGRLDREQAGLLSESPTPRLMMKGFGQKAPGEILPGPRASKLEWVYPNLDLSVPGASATRR
jgi:hypothetical protein